MRILDIDLDFFLDEIAYSKKRNNQRLNKKNYIPWSSEQVEWFLESKIGLSKNNPLPGVVFNHHDEVFFWCRDYKNNGNQDDFSIVHVDAHSDLATGFDACFLYIMETMLRKSIIERPRIEDADNLQKLNSGNFLLFMVACEWIENLTFVKHHKSNETYYPFYFQNNQIETNMIQLKCFNDNVIRNIIRYGDNLSTEIANLNPVSVTRSVPYEVVKWCDYNKAYNFDYIFLTKSPSYTPRTSDVLIDTVKLYMKIENGTT